MIATTIATTATVEAATITPLPPQLAGMWGIPWSGGTEYLTLSDSRFMFFRNDPSGGFAFGHVSVSGNTITFFSSNHCTGTGTYEWSLSNGGLTFVQVASSSDQCPREAVLTSGTWRRR